MREAAYWKSPQKRNAVQLRRFLFETIRQIALKQRKKLAPEWLRASFFSLTERHYRRSGIFR
jgi:hypothetical protein